MGHQNPPSWQTANKPFWRATTSSLNSRLGIFILSYQWRKRWGSFIIFECLKFLRATKTFSSKESVVGLLSIIGADLLTAEIRNLSPTTTPSPTFVSDREWDGVDKHLGHQLQASDRRGEKKTKVFAIFIAFCYFSFKQFDNFSFAFLFYFPVS